jgi:hypothetical protein
MTLTEVMLSVIILCIITPGLVMLMTSMTKGFTGYEAGVNLRQLNQVALNQMYLRVGSNKRIFGNNTNDIAYLNKISLTGNPALLTGSLLPTVEDTGTLTPGTTNFLSSSVGNSLFFANNDTSLEVLTGTNTTRVDIFRFNYYYLTSVNPKSISSASSYRLVQWRSVQFADYEELANITNLTRQSNVIKALGSSKITYAWDYDNTNASSAFYTLSSTTGLITASPSLMLPQYECNVLTTLITNLILGGYGYGVSANSAGWAQAPKTVPLYATASSAFPSGFEVAVCGNSAGRQVLLRCVLVAQGSMPDIVADDMQVVATCRDLW